MKLRKNGPWVNLALVAVGLVAFLGAKTLVMGGISIAQNSLTPKADLEERLDRTVAGDPVMSALSESFPIEWQEMRSEMVADVRSSISALDVERRSHARTRAFMLGKTPEIAAAPSAALLEIARKDLALVSLLQEENEQHCADFGMRGLKPGSNLSPAAMQLAGQAARARVLAARQGTDSPQPRRPASDADWDNTFDVMQRNGTSDRVFAAFGGPTSTSADQCAAAVQLYRALSELPVDLAARVYASITLEAANTTSP